MVVGDPGNEHALRRAFGQFATGVALVSARDCGGEPIAITVNSLASLSLSPALLLWSIAKRSTRHGAFVQAAHFAVQVLGIDQLEVSRRFGGRQAGAPRYDEWRSESGTGGTPLLPACLALFECERHAVYEGGDHSIVVGRIVALSWADGQPLLFHNGGYRDLESVPVSASKASAALPARHAA